MTHPLLRKLRFGARLTTEDESVLMSILDPARTVSPREDVAEEGIRPHALPLIVEGWACRYSTLANGQRQIISLFIPGDLCEPFGMLPRFMDHSVATLTPVIMSPVRVERLKSAVTSSPRIEEALWWDLLVSTAIDREHLVSLGRRTATERLGHLFCELHLRLDMVGLVDGMGYEMPVTQADLGDLLGLSMVHVNRSLQELRRTGLMSLRGRRLTINDLHGLRELSFFDEGYLHPEGANA
ncbi:Crp/Fnr family transcriptional regulator [Rhodopseudomonas sp. HC1]|nr:Crp/Fnr family transcriptional regulator [Rhodopseudomonas infernalis]MCG6206400.1 Crp/Fnr family transcriptional regulator [Rhodopseudomonas infernalis]